MKKKAVIFDLDGVLVDACEWHRISLNKALKKVCNYEISLDDHYKDFNGIPTRVKLKKLSDLGIIDNSLHQKVYDLKQSLTLETIKKNAIIRKEKIELINYLKNHNYIVCCFTNSIRETAFLMLEKTGIFDLFDMIITNQDVTEPKPSPEGYNKIVSMFSLDRKNVYIVEDSPKGLESAKKSGCNVIKVDGPEQVNIENIKSYIEKI